MSELENTAHKHL